MCEKASGKANFVRVLVEVDAAKGLVDHVEVNYKSLGRSMKLKVDYDWRPPVCGCCKVFGHNYEHCVHRIISEVEKKFRNENETQKTDTGLNEGNNGNEWKTVSGKESVRKEGNNVSVNGQRNFYGEGPSRGGSMVEVKKDNTTKDDQSKENVQKNKNKGKMDTDGVESSGASNKNATYNNMYSTLVDEMETEKDLAWEATRHRIDDVCSKGLKV
ncbi:DUF4283 domain-containing protein [Artemisia annua]|uniref:DUF4283 domain-containing protein n=1 Tax=Artemisia annua TaxID=35608 RepID=A0A2U1LVW5_ARTAN|nr:DUF4283 domain-containing protein [Artemisia annua]